MKFHNHQDNQGGTPNPTTSNSPAGFTLLELAIALLLIALLVGLVFSTARYSLLLGNSVVKSQNDEMLHQALFDLLENRFSSLPGNTRMQISVSDSSSHYLSDITLQNVPISLTWGNEERTAKTIQLSTVYRSSGLLDIVLRFYENEILDPNGADPLSANLPQSSEKPFAEIVLISDVRFFEWRVLDGRTMEYQYDWDLPGRLPLQMELVCAFGSSGETNRQVFWIPPRQNPEFFMRQLQSNAAGNASTPPPETENPADPATPPDTDVTTPVLPPPNR